MTSSNEHLAAFDEFRPLLFSIAYRILGRAVEAEDMLQEAYLRWQGVDVAEVDSPKNFLAAIVTRLSIDKLRSAQAQREQYTGVWLPEPILTQPGQALTDTVEQKETLTMAVMMLLEKLSPEERAVFVLREAFDYDYAEIAETLEKTPEAVRQLMSRARKRLTQAKARYEISLDEQRRLAERFVAAVEMGDMGELQTILAADVVHLSDGNGMIGVARNPIVGADKVIRFFFGLKRLAPKQTELRLAEINGQMGFIVYFNQTVYATICFEYQAGKILNSYGVVNAEKLSHLSGRQLG